MSEYYTLSPRKLGCEVIGIDLRTEIRPQVFHQIKNDVTRHRFLLFRNQGVIDGLKQVEITQWFGKLESSFPYHPRQPHPDVQRISNDENEGNLRAGTSGWHIDGSFLWEPYPYTIFHIISVPRDGPTLFMPLTEVIERLSAEKREHWDQLWMVDDRRKGPIHPLIYHHPVTDKLVMCIHLGRIESFISNYGSPDEKEVTNWQYGEILGQLREEIAENNKDLIYKHEVRYTIRRQGVDVQRNYKFSSEFTSYKFTSVKVTL